MMIGCDVLWRQIVAKKTKSLNMSKLLREPFHVLTITLLSFLLPLSFLLLSRLSCNSYFSISPALPGGFFSSVLSLFVDTNPTLLLALLSLLGVATLVHCLTGGMLGGSSKRVARGSGLHAAWAILCALQVCVCLGIEGIMGIAPLSHGARDGSGVGAREGGFLGRVAFFLGLHETMLHWARVVVKPVVDESVLGGHRDERWPERAAMAMGLGWLWWWQLRDEVDALIVVPEVKTELSMGLEASDFVGWWLYYLTSTIGAIKVAKDLMWVSMVLIFTRLRIRRRTPLENSGDGTIGEEEDKV